MDLGIPGSILIPQPLHEHIYWDQASVLKQIGLLAGDSLPVFGAETAKKVLDPKFSFRK